MREKISLDVESVLTDIMNPFFDRYNEKHGTDYSRDDMVDWDWIPRELDIDEFLSMTEDQWKRRMFDELPPEEENLPQTVESLSRRYPVDIVTSRVGCDEAIQDWLEHYGITHYNQFVSGESGKASLDYKFYIDDNPKLADSIDGDQVLFLVRQSWNRGVEAENVIPVNSVREVVDEIERF